MFTFDVVATAAVVSPSIIVDASGTARAVASFVLVLAGSVALVSRRATTVDRAVELAGDGSPIAVVYGLIVFGLLGFVGGYALTQAAQIRPAGGVIFWLVLVAAIAAGLGMCALGYVVLGTLVTELEGARRPWVGAVVGAGLSALPWVAFPPLPALALWTLVAAVGLGGFARQWIQTDGHSRGRSGGESG